MTMYHRADEHEWILTLPAKCACGVSSEVRIPLRAVQEALGAWSASWGKVAEPEREAEYLASLEARQYGVAEPEYAFEPEPMPRMQTWPPEREGER